MIDSHCHIDRIDVSNLKGGYGELIKNANARGVRGILCVSILPDDKKPQKFADFYECVWATVGLHPCYVDDALLKSSSELICLSSAKNIVGFGETGLDGFHEKVSDTQRKSFISHLEAGKVANLPNVIHSRNASVETIDLIHRYGSTRSVGVLHCFTDNWNVAKKALDMGLYISMSGIVSFPKSLELHEVCKKIPKERLLIETDAPWLAPVPYRGKKNEPAFVYHVAKAVAKIRGVSVEEIDERTTENFFRLFPRATY